jgi:SAM-dependent methyltransferase
VARRENFTVIPVRFPLQWLGPVLVICAVAVVPAGAATEPDAPYVPTPPGVVDAMLKLAKVGPEDYVIDLGSGDGRILIAAAKQYGARGHGVEIDGSLVNDARAEAKRQGVSGRVEFREENLYLTDFSRATVMTLYLFPRLLMDLRPRFMRELRPGTRIVSHDFDMDNWEPDARVTVPVPDKPYGPPRSDVYLWVVPANAAGTWRWRLEEGARAVDFELTLTQAFQMLEGKATVAGKEVRFEQGRMRGQEIRFILTSAAGGRTLLHEFGGRISGDTITGKVKTGGREEDWMAMRSRRGSMNIER